VNRARALPAVVTAAALLGLLGLSGCSGTSGKDPDGVTAYSGKRVQAGANGIFAVPDRHPSPLVKGESVAGDGTVDVSALKGQVVVLNFWADWCAPCRAEAPVLNEVYARTKDSGVAFVGVNVKDDRNAAQNFERVMAVPYPSIYDQPAVQLTRFRKVIPQTPPSTLLIDRQGRVAGIYNGAVTFTALQASVQALAAEPAT
jgi:thiol-disulfide isomerase/thioredoxin